MEVEERAKGRAVASKSNADCSVGLASFVEAEILDEVEEILMLLVEP